jgi:hypothetical protein
MKETFGELLDVDVHAYEERSSLTQARLRYLGIVP